MGFVLHVLHPGEQLTALSATQSSTYAGDIKHPAAYCIDGETRPGKGMRKYAFCHTQRERYPWFAADYGKTYVIERVKIFNRHDCCGKRTRNVEVRVSEELPTSASQKFSGGSLLGTFAGPGSNGQHIEISGGDIW